MSEQIKELVKDMKNDKFYDMAGGDVADFNDKQWALLQKNMKRGQTKQQAQVLKNARDSYHPSSFENFTLDHDSWLIDSDHYEKLAKITNYDRTQMTRTISDFIDSEFSKSGKDLDNNKSNKNFKTNKSWIVTATHYEKLHKMSDGDTDKMTRTISDFIDSSSGY